jgi:NAD(P)-dependent dehydrogenase (short-subunit alcohol dehydrogenase family)
LGSNPGTWCFRGIPTHICCQSLQYVINNAGIYSRLAGLEDVTAADMLADFTTNCIGPLLAVQQLHK